ncbi:zinc ribbon domain-containing protein [Clostridium tarantellae]|uniref:Zinc-ribbon domain-containing protein n=1 Tax=Clostridium tarantellae TaxID=39493 RepID=A0A6I1MQD0_9CLOT|nr:zinc ribbon domain-containing protein [Clostridium tarantellae]MPQ43081.1 zinc-ribbon domain-containing protein [Clostridium tarantellae]
MFFIGIFGLSTKEKEIKVLNNIQCKNCKCDTRGKLIKTFQCFEFFFIPVFKWNEKYYVVCERCNTIYEIPKEKGKDIEKGENLELTYWDLKAIDSEYNNINYSQKITCPNCGKVLESNFEYCPYCGTKIK